MITPNKKYEISSEEISDLMVGALEGGINYWCWRAEINDPDKYDNETLASDVIGLGGSLTLYDTDSSDQWELTQEKFLKGVEKTMEWGEFESIEDMMECSDSETSDVLIQFAIFDEIVFA
jgi:hypothetical protein